MIHWQYLTIEMEKYFWCLTLVAAFLLQSCSENGDTTDKRPEIYFNNVPAERSGITFSNTLIPLEDLNIIEYLYYYNGGGVAIGDINNDGLADIYFTANQTSDRLYLNLGNLQFRDITGEAGISLDSTWSTGVTMEDINNDGFLDIYVSKVGAYKMQHTHNKLYLNNGDLSFTESSEEYGLDFSGLSTQASFFDYDNDGDMDVYLMNHSVHTLRSYGGIDKRLETDSLSGDRFFENKLNEGIAKFSDVTGASGIYSSPLGYGLALTTSDINNDGLIDIYVGNDFHENDYLYINQGDKTFKESSAQYLNHTTRFTMGVDISDLNNDLLPDIFSLDMMPYDHEIFLKSAGEDSDKVSQIKKNFGFQTQYARNMLQLNKGGQAFTDIALMTNTHATDWSWSVLLQDFDNDGLKDIFITNGIYKRPNDLDYITYLSNVDFAEYSQAQQDEIEQRLIERMPTVSIPNVIFKNKGNYEFDRLNSESGFMDSYSNGAAFGDLDNDGDLDLVINNVNMVAGILENQSSPGINKNYIAIGLEGDSLRKNPSGSKVYVYANGRIHVNELKSTRGFQSSSSHTLHFGLGEATKVDSIKVNWLDGSTQIASGFEVNRRYLITKTTGSAIHVKTNKLPLDTYDLFPYTHIENDYLDYDREPLIPEKLSTEGPAFVKADFNGDGLNDLFIGGSKYQSPALFIKREAGGFTLNEESHFIDDNIYEDVDATAFDLENDGDMDLYVVSGGNELIEGDQSLEDRIYVNDGKANFSRLNTSLLRTNGGSVSSGDFDGDGFDDLFVGSRSIPGGYGLSPYSYILRNNGEGSFDIIEKFRMGMVTDSQWADLNNDAMPDLVVVGDWMPVSVLMNKGNLHFDDETGNLGLNGSNGMWNTVLVSDLDGNGYKDIIAGNSGLNVKLKASEDHPMKLYLDDFDENGNLDPVIFYDFFGHPVPFASKDKLVGQMPSLKKKFLHYTSFSKIATIKDLTGKNEEDILEVKKITTLSSMFYLNVGSHFEGKPLPKEAQMSSIEDIVYNEDTHTLFFVGNFLDYTAELGESASNPGGVLKFTTDGNFDFLQNLPLPTGLNSRRISNLGDTGLLIISNNDKAYLLKSPMY
jgi:hypothetical protein